jgi:hypothetical protein
VTLQATHIECRIQVAAEESHGNDDDNGDEGDHDAVFNSGGTLFVTADTSFSVRENSDHLITPDRAMALGVIVCSRA